MFLTQSKFAVALVLGACLMVVGGRLLADDLPKFVDENKNTLVKKHKDKLKIEASSAFAGYPATRLIDGELGTAWFSTTGDSVAKGKTPSITITFPEDVIVTRVSVAGNRDIDYPKGYSVLSGKIEYLDADGKSLGKEEKDGEGKAYDIEFKPKEVIKNVRTIKFTVVKDEGDKNGFGDIALGEFLIE